ncbi:MAG: MFS transporter [Erysipelothrix sp.]|nr:MFS transporter [Erysipelothrix sp.]
MKKKIVGFSSLIFIAFMAHGMINTQSIPYLTSLGYDSIQRGYIMSFYAVVAMVGQFVAGYLCDKYKTIKRFFIFLGIVLTGFIFLTFTLNDKNFLVHFIFMGNTIGLIRIIDNLLETWIIEVDGLYEHFGIVRSLGSFGWALSSLISGYLIIYKGYSFMMWVSIILNISVIIISFILEDANKDEGTSIEVSEIFTLFKNKQYILLVLVYSLAFIVYNADQVSVTDYIFFIGGQESDIGLKWFMQALSELPLLLAATYVLNRLSGKKMMILGSAVLGLRFVSYAVFPNVNAVIFLSLLQGLSFPLILVSQKELILRETPKHLRSTGQMVAIAFSTGLSAILSPIIAGYLGAIFSIRIVVLGFGLFMILPVLLMFSYQPSRIT